MGRYRVAAPQHKCRAAKRLMKAWVEGKHDEACARLSAYIEEVKKINPGSICSCIFESLDLVPILKRLFISFEAMMIGFKRGCRPFIGVDVCFLKGSYEGVLLIAFGLDGNNGYFPIAYGVVGQENKSNWAHFFKALRLCLEGVDLSKMTFISERHKV